MLIRTAAFELEVTRSSIYAETRAFAFWWEFAARPILSRKTAQEG